jgi:hypothetical protein
MKLKDMISAEQIKRLNETAAPGFKNRKFGDKLPTLDSVQKAYEAKQAKKGDKLNEEYIEAMDVVELGNLLGKIGTLWNDWKRGPMTEPSDIKPAQKELIGWITRWMKQRLK